MNRAVPHSKANRTLPLVLAPALPAIAWGIARRARALVIPAHPPAPALVLGCRPGPGLSARVDGAVALWRAGRVTQICVSGRAEAEAGLRRARAGGVAEAALIAEPHARFTWENLIFARALLGPGPWWLISDRWHLPRSLLLAEAAGIAALPVPVDRPGRRRVVWTEAASLLAAVGRGNVGLGQVGALVTAPRRSSRRGERG